MTAAASARALVPTRVETLLGVIRPDREDRLHALLRAARLGEAGAAAQLRASVRAAAWDCGAAITNGVIVPIPPHLPAPTGVVVGLVAQALSNARGWPVESEALVRHLPVPEAKAGGVRDARAEQRSLRWRMPAAGDVIVLVDDVVRSGATLVAAERTIRAAGDDRPIVCIVVCRVDEGA